MRRFAATLIATLGALYSATAGSALALAPGIQGFKLSGSVDWFPCAIPTCGGTLGGLGTATVTGLSTANLPFVAAWPDPTKTLPSSNTTGILSGIFDFCLAGGPTPSLSGSGTGSFTLTGGLLDYQGAQTSGAVLAGTFEWTRSGGDGLVISVSGATVKNGAGVVIAYQADLVEGAGSGLWRVTSSGTGTCGSPLANPAIEITAAYLAPE